MPDTTFLVLAGIALPLIGAALVHFGRAGRGVAVTAAALSLVCIAASVWPTMFPTHAASDLFTFGPAGTQIVMVDAISGLPMLIYSCLVLAVLIAAPRSDVHTGTLILLSSTLAVYAAGNPLVLFLGWTASAFPVLARMWPREQGAGARTHLPAIAIAASVGLLGLGLALMHFAPSAAPYAFALVLLAALVRKGVFPFHTWIIAAFTNGSLLPFGLFVNAHLGAFVVARVAIPMFPEISRDALTLVSALAIVSAIYTAFTGLGERNPRRLLALLTTSQAAFILAGLESRNAEGITGALTYWVVVAVATMGLLIVYRALEKRFAGLAETEYAGLAASAPRMAAFFAVCGLALVGLPGTLGFAAGDLLFHGALSGHPLLGVALPLATALNAINVFRLFSTLFFGRRTTLVPAFPDALRRERLVLSAVVVFLIVGGIAPRLVISSRAASAEAISAVLSGPDAGDVAH